MYIEVPHKFAIHLRNQRLLRLLSIVAIMVVIFLVTSRTNLIVVVGIPLAGILMTLLHSNKDVFYYFDSRGISFSTKSNVGAYTANSEMIGRYWIYWSNDRITEVRYSHWRQLSALLITTHKRPQGYIVPVKREDLEKTLRFVENLI